MTDESLQRSRQNCCRLCLAPDSECISILNSYAADKEPLATKIQNCVNIKITINDSLSLRICHACISYLNSWQSFKNRCIVAQAKQRNLLEARQRQQLSENNVSMEPVHDDITTHQQHDNQYYAQSDDFQEHSNLSSSILDGITSLKKRRSLTVYPLPALQVKDEPVDLDEEYNKQDDSDDQMVDPTLFLERTEEEGDELVVDGAGNYDYNRERPVPLVKSATPSDTKEASCRSCNLKFSTRANARRHERNFHPDLFDGIPPSQNNTPSSSKSSLPYESQSLAVATQQQKYRQDFNTTDFGPIDYDNPDKYQHLLTDEKIIFLQQNEEFIQQYQTMTCRCCDKAFLTYKMFMAHMRKKYATLPRNLCFNCLKLNDSKALFISHLKKRNCINLYRVLQSLMEKNKEFAAAVAATAAAVPEKLRAKELLVNKMYECKLCPKKFRLKLEFRSHVYDEHTDIQKRDVGQTQCSFCSLLIEDSADRKRHYNNMDCIVTLRCVTCDATFENNQKFLDHVYEKHLSGFGEQSFMNVETPPKKLSIGGASSTDDSRSSQSAIANTSKSQYFSRMPQACPICGQQYNNYNNVLRHMESKHPDQLPQTYKCVKCSIGYPRLSNLREHMVTAHSSGKARNHGFEYIVNADAVKITGSSTNSNAYSGRYDYVMKDLMSITNGGNLVDEDDVQETPSKKLCLENVPSNANGASFSNNSVNSMKECSICNAVFGNNIGLSNHMRSHAATAYSSQAMSTAKSGGATSTISLAKAKSPTSLQEPTSNSKTVTKRSLEQAADRRFRRMRCRICQRRFSSKKSYRFHMLNDHQICNVQFIKCKLCDAEFAYEKGLKVHMFKIHNTMLKDEMIVKQYECDICSIVYRTEDQLLQHKETVHNLHNPKADEKPTNANENSTSGNSRKSLDKIPATTTAISSQYWYQCKYCASNFNTNKKLAIHVNSHDEFDSNDYSCKDCGNVYSGRKSLWVHRYKKHPPIAEPSECVLCKKVFFDNQMLQNHTPTCNRKPIDSAGEKADNSMLVYKHKTGDDEDESSHDADRSNIGSLVTGEVDVNAMKIKLPEVNCTICGQRFADQELFAKHIQMHERELYTDNPLASMFDTGPADPNQFFLDRVNDNGEYACDLCHKTFSQMVALKVHRKWHFRGDSKQNQTEVEPNVSSTQNQTNLQHQQGLQAVGLMRVASPSRPQKRKRELKCDYCPSTFISNNNLRRHIYELHKEAIGNFPTPPKIKIDKYLHCARCDLKFEKKLQWVEHKVSDARTTKPFGPFQWGCELCGAYVSRKEKLINHIYNHMKEKKIVSVYEQTEIDEQPQNEENKEENKKQIKSESDKDEDTNSEKKQNVKNDDKSKATEKTTVYDEENMEDYNSELGVEENDDEENDDEENEDEDNEDEDNEDEDNEDDENENEDDDVEQNENDENDRHESEEIDYGDNQNVENENEESCENDKNDENDEENYENKNHNETNENEESYENEDVDVPTEVDAETVEEGLDNNIESSDEEAEADEDYDHIITENEHSADEDDEDIDMEDVDEAIETNDEETNKVESAEEKVTKSTSYKKVSDNTGKKGSLEAYSSDDENDDDIVSVTENKTSSGSGTKSHSNVKHSLNKARFACDLCSVFFDSQQELQKHVKMHFLNGPGSVTLTTFQPKNFKSRDLSSSSSSSSSDDLTQSS